MVFIDALMNFFSPKRQVCKAEMDAGFWLQVAGF
jgi:hypothetical protein